MYKVNVATVQDWAANYTGEPFHALLCDAPYEMEFMGKGWDGSGVAFDAGVWASLADHLHPGAFLFVFAGTINDDLISYAMRQAGLVKFHKQIYWGYGSGFPKATRIKDNRFSGHRYGLQALKPAAETILIFRKPYQGKPVDSITQTGAGALWVDGGRIKTEDDLSGGTYGGIFSGTRDENGNLVKAIGSGDKGRWPANLLLSHAPDCGDTCADGCPVKAIGEQSGERGGSNPIIRPEGFTRFDGSHYANGNEYKSPSFISTGYNDTGTAARFFFNADYALERLEAADAVRYQAKASRRERDAGLDGMPIVRRPSGSSNNLKQWERGEREFEDLDEKSKTLAQKSKNFHPTVKPITLTRYLATLLLPPVEYAPRRILVPFAGSGSEMIGAALAGWEYIEGIEMSAEYAEIARARLDHWTGVLKMRSENENTKDIDYD